MKKSIRYMKLFCCEYGTTMSINGLATISAILLTLQDGKGASNNDAQHSTLDSSLLSILDPKTLLDLIPIVGPQNPDGDLDFPQLAAKYGHPAEEYVVYTEDGYRLKVFRLPGCGHGLPVLLFHGILDSSDTWIIRGNESLAIKLANAGYDVWLGNVRGNKYSQENASVSLDLNSTYWNFTFHEYGVYDLPTTIDLALSTTGAPMLNLIGHSQGTTISFVLLSTRPEYNDKVNLLITLAPVVYLQNSPPPLGIFLRSLPEIYETLKTVQEYQVFSETSPLLAAVRLACSTITTAYVACLQGIVYQYTGYDLSQIDPTFSLVMFKHVPTATSTKNALHYGQVTIRKTFAQFDYGSEGNMIAYNSDEPPQYMLENVRTKVVLLTATNDFFSTQPDVALLRRRLPNVVKFVIIPRPEMNHLDYVWGENMSTYLFPYIFDSLDCFGEGSP